MDPLHPNTGLLPPTLRALAIGLLVETVVPMLHRSRGESRGPRVQGEADAEGKAELWQNLRAKCDDLATLVVRADDPEEAAAYVLGYLPKHLEYLFELVCGRKRVPVLNGVAAGCEVAHRNGEHPANPG
jgi:hypothetical protein